MVPTPIALGLNVCEKIVVEEVTKNVTLINCFSKMFVAGFPTGPQQFAVHSTLRDGQGRANIRLVVARSDTHEVVYSQQGAIDFPDRLTEVRTLFRVAQCSFPAPGRYVLTLLIDGDWVAQREIDVVSRGVQS
jgi:hypothetical protein